MGKILVSCLPKPSYKAFNKHFVTNLPSSDVSHPRFIEENGQLYYL